MTSYPKPTKKDRLSSKSRDKAELSDYRKQQASLAKHRDKSQCVFCHFLLGKEVPAADVHHVYGRAKKVGDIREQYRSLACTCRKHHPQPIKSDFPGDNLAWVVGVLEQANTNPINPEFSHPSPSFLEQQTIVEGTRL